MLSYNECWEKSDDHGWNVLISCLPQENTTKEKCLIVPIANYALIDN